MKRSNRRLQCFIRHVLRRIAEALTRLLVHSGADMLDDHT